MIPKDLQQIINDLDDQLPYMESALDHINCAISEDGTKQRPVTNPIGMSSDLTDGINLLKKLCYEYSNIYNCEKLPNVLNKQQQSGDKKQ